MCQHGCCAAEKRMDHPLPAAAQPPQSMQKPTGWWMGQICSFWVFYWLHVEAQASARIQHSVRERQTNTSIPILHCHVPDFKYARFLWQENHYEYFKMQQRVKINYIGWPLFFSFFFKNSLFTSTFTLGTLYTVKVIALFLHILWDAGCSTHSYQILQHNISESMLNLYGQQK